MNKHLLWVLGAAVLTAAFSCTSCFLKENAPENVFLHSNAIYSFNGSINKLFNVSYSIIPRSVSVTDYGISAFDSQKKQLIMYSEKGKVLWAKNIDAKHATIKGNTILTCNSVYSLDSGNEGFTYTLYKIIGKRKLKVLWTGNIPIFNSDTYFIDDNKVIISGADKKDTEHFLYYISEGNEPEIIAKDMPKMMENKDPTSSEEYKEVWTFLNITSQKDKFILFQSTGIKANIDKKIYIVPRNEDGSFGSVQVKEVVIPQEAKCFMGFSFVLNDKAVLPVVLEDRSIALCTFDSNAEVEKVTEGALGCIVPLFTVTDANGKQSFCYMASDPVDNYGFYKFAIFDGEEIKFLDFE